MPTDDAGVSQHIGGNRQRIVVSRRIDRKRDDLRFDFHAVRPFRRAGDTALDDLLVDRVVRCDRPHAR